jgi:hypothetical protein
MGIMKRVIVVCNGESVLNQELGNLINNFDAVVRIGDFKINGYEKWVGTKTDIVINRERQVPEIAQKKSLKYWSPHKIVDSEKLLYSKKLTNEEIEKIKVQTGIQMPTTGLIAYYLTKKYIPNSEVYYIGMDFHCGGHYWDKSHSHFEWSLGLPSPHEPIKERLWYTKMNKAKKIFDLVNYSLNNCPGT